MSGSLMLSVSMCVCVCIYIISYINIFHSWDPDLKFIKVWGELQVQGVWV